MRVPTRFMWANVYTRRGSRNQAFTTCPFLSLTPPSSNSPEGETSVRLR